jgi:hypothetical protein
MMHLSRREFLATGTAGAMLAPAADTCSLARNSQRGWLEIRLGERVRKHVMEGLIPGNT